jgi:hypothetical protein
MESVSTATTASLQQCRHTLPPARAASPEAQGSATYEAFYGLHERPFSLSTDPRFFYHSTTHDHGRGDARRNQAARRAGRDDRCGRLGKTTLCRAVLDQLDRRTLTSLVTDKFISTEDLLKTLLAGFRRHLARRCGARHAGERVTGSRPRCTIFSCPRRPAGVRRRHHRRCPRLRQARCSARSALAEDIGDEPALQIVLVGQPSLEKTLGRARSVNGTSVSRRAAG